jgi:TolB-like protein
MAPAGVAVAVLALGFVGWQLLGKGGGTRASDGLGAGGLDPRQVAVLYFEDLSSDGEWEHVADGLTEGLIQKLSAVQGLGVVSRNGVEPYRASDLARDSIARALEAGSLVSGSVEPAGDRLRVVARLIEGESGADIERASFELPAGDLLVALDSVTETVSRFLRQRLGKEIRVRERRAETASVEAWGLAQRGYEGAPATWPIKTTGREPVGSCSERTRSSRLPRPRMSGG